VSIVNALQLEAARATPASSRFNYDAMPRLKSLKIAVYSVFAADTLLYDVTFTSDLKVIRSNCEIAITPPHLRPYDHISDALATLHWLRVAERVQYKIAVLTFKVLHRSRQRATISGTSCRRR